MATKKTKKYQDGGGVVTRADIKNAKRAAKLKRIQEGTEPSLYEKAANITGNVAKTAGAVAETTKAISDARRGAGSAGGPGFKKGGATRKMQKGGAMSDIKSGAKQIAKGVSKGVDNSKKVVKAAIKTTPQYQAYKTTGKAAKRLDDKLEKRYPNYTGKGTVYDGVKQGVKSLFGYETGGVVNSNTSVKKQTVAGSKGVKSGVNSKVTTSKIAKGRAGGTSVSPKAAVPKAKYGMGIRKKG